MFLLAYNKQIKFHFFDSESLNGFYVSIIYLLNFLEMLYK